jgi:O-antigen ligase
MIQNGADTRASHAHNIVLEFMADTGSIGLLGLIGAFVLVLRFWRGLDQRRRQEAFPYAIALLAIAFPLNSHFAIFGVYTMSVIWVLVGLMAAAGLSEPRNKPGTV